MAVWEESKKCVLGGGEHDKIEIELSKSDDGRFSFNINSSMLENNMCSSCDISANQLWQLKELIDELIQGVDTSIPTYVLMKLPPQKEPVYFIVDHAIYDHDKGKTDIPNSPERVEGTKYYLEENTCPTNYICIPAIVHQGDTDPHRLFEYCSEVLASEVSEDAEDWEKHFPEITGKPTIIDANYKESETVLLIEGT